MKIIIIGGDRRFVHLLHALEEDGHSVFPLALDWALPVLGPPDFAGADFVILPLPAEREGFLNAPFSEGRHRLREILEGIPAGKTVFAGMAGEPLRSLCAERGLRLRDYFRREELQIKNAAITAAGAVELLGGPLGVSGRRVLISGFGRIGQLLALRLKDAGAEVGVAARSAPSRARAEAMGFAAMPISGAAGPGWDAVVNTVPATIFGGKEIAAFAGAELLELASPPYGFDFAAAERLGKKIELASGLPARCDPQAAAGAIKDTIYNMLEE